MAPPSDSIDPVLSDIAKRIVEHHDHDRGTNVPCWVYVYDPAEEFAVRADIVKIATWLRAPGHGVDCVSVSLADAFWEAIDESGMYGELIEQERAADGDPRAQA